MEEKKKKKGNKSKKNKGTNTKQKKQKKEKPPKQYNKFLSMLLLGVVYRSHKRKNENLQNMYSCKYTKRYSRGGHFEARYLADVENPVPIQKLSDFYKEKERSRSPSNTTISRSMDTVDRMSKGSSRRVSPESSASAVSDKHVYRARRMASKRSTKKFRNLEDSDSWSNADEDRTRRTQYRSVMDLPLAYVEGGSKKTDKSPSKESRSNEGSHNASLKGLKGSSRDNSLRQRNSGGRDKPKAQHVRPTSAPKASQGPGKTVSQRTTPGTRAVAPQASRTTTATQASATTQASANTQASATSRATGATTLASTPSQASAISRPTGAATLAATYRQASVTTQVSTASRATGAANQVSTPSRTTTTAAKAGATTAGAGASAAATRAATPVRQTAGGRPTGVAKSRGGPQRPTQSAAPLRPAPAEKSVAEPRRRSIDPSVAQSQAGPRRSIDRRRSVDTPTTQHQIDRRRSVDQQGKDVKPSTAPRAQPSVASRAPANTRQRVTRMPTTAPQKPASPSPEKSVVAKPIESGLSIGKSPPQPAEKESKVPVKTTAAAIKVTDSDQRSKTGELSQEPGTSKITTSGSATSQRSRSPNRQMKPAKSGTLLSRQINVSSRSIIKPPSQPSSEQSEESNKERQRIEAARGESRVGSEQGPSSRRSV